MSDLRERYERLTWISFMMAANREDLAAKALIRFMALSKFFTNSVYIFRNGAHDFITSPVNGVKKRVIRLPYSVFTINVPLAVCFATVCAKQNCPNTRDLTVTCISECMHPPFGRFHLDHTFYGRIAGGVRGTLLVNSLYIKQRVSDLRQRKTKSRPPTVHKSSC